MPITTDAFVNRTTFGTPASGSGDAFDPSTFGTGTTGRSLETTSGDSNPISRQFDKAEDSTSKFLNNIPTMNTAAASEAADKQKTDSLAKEELGQLDKEATSADATGTDTTGTDTTGAATTSATPEQNAQTLENGDATGDPPTNLTLPPGTDIDKIIGANGGLIDKLNWHTTQQGVPVGDALAQKITGNKTETLADLEQKAKAGDPKARNDLAKVAWAAQGANNVTEEDGSERPDNERHASTLAGYTSLKGGVANHGTPAGIMQDYLQNGQSITGSTTLATSRTYADGTPKSNATMIGEKIAGFFEKMFSFICPPLGDLVKMAVDGATKIRDEKAGDKDAAHNDSETIKQDGKNFGKDFGEFAASMIGGPEMAELGTVVRGVANGVKDGVEDVAKGATRAGEDIGKGEQRAADALSSMNLQSVADDVLDKFAKSMGLSGKDELKQTLEDNPNAAALLDELRSQGQSYLTGQVQASLMQPSASAQQQPLSVAA